MSASSESDMSKDSLDIDDDGYFDSYIYDDEDDFAESLAFDGGYQNHNLNIIGSVEQPWTVYLESRDGARG